MTGRDWQAYWNQRIDDPDIDTSAALRQVGKTVLGNPIETAQLQILADHIANTLSLEPSDKAADLGCGNGLLTSLLAPYVRSVLALDYSAPLIEVAKQHFPRETIRYEVADLRNLSCRNFNLTEFNKAWCCEVLQHLSSDEALGMLRELLAGLPAGGLVLACGIPDQAKLRAFYNSPERWALYERNLCLGQEQIGHWWHRDELMEIVGKAGGRMRFVEPPGTFYTSHYRFDALIERQR